MEFIYPNDELEEIEARLYSEAYHSKAQDEDFQNLITPEEREPLNQRLRYFDNCSGPNLCNNINPNFIPLESTNQLVSQLPIIQNNITVIPPENFHIVPNRLTVNQYTVPIIEILPPINNSNYLTSWLQRNQSVVNAPVGKKQFQNRPRRKNRQEKRKKRVQEIICLSDDSEEECVIMTRKENEQNSVLNVEDEDIIFIPPPPQEIINVDDESQDVVVSSNEKILENIELNTKCDNLNELRKQSDNVETANDFLENANVTSGSSNFNFSLHGSDFNNASQSEFVKPNSLGQGNDACETESSTTCSNDQRTDFNNSVKTIVFNEVDFPKGDIFSENNLETFSSLITPKRTPESNNNSKKDVTDEQSVILNVTPRKCKKKLPNLSPMPIVVQNSSKSVVAKKKEKGFQRRLIKKLLKDKISQMKDIQKKSDKKKKKKSKVNKSVVVNKKLQNVPVTVQIPECKNKNVNTSRKIDRKKKPLQVVNSNESATKRRKKSHENISTAQIIDIKAPDHSLSTNNVSGGVSVHNEKLPPSVDVRELTSEKNSQNSGDSFIVIDELNDSNSSDLEIVESVNCTNDGSNKIDDLLLANCQRDELLSKTDFTSDNFDVLTIQKTQSDDPEKWRILDIDKSLLLSYTSGPRCLRCRHFGHRSKNCVEKLEPPRCSLCGGDDHQEPRCPNKICRQCGNKGDYSMSYCWSCFKFRNSECRLCHMTGHISKTCPDLWRRYHLTTSVGPLVEPKKPNLKPKSQWWCSGCARNGHLEHECTYYHRVYPPTTPTVISYEDVFPSEDLFNVEVEGTVQKDSKKKGSDDGNNKIAVVPDPLPTTSSSIVESAQLINREQNDPPRTEKLAKDDTKAKSPCQKINKKIKQNVIGLKYSDGVPQPKYASVPEKTTSTAELNKKDNASNLQHDVIPESKIITKKTPDTTSVQKTVDIPKQNVICLQHNDGLPQPDYGILPEETNTNNEGSICLQHTGGVPVPSYKFVKEDTVNLQHDNKILETEISNKKKSDYRTVVKDSKSDNLSISISNIQNSASVATTTKIKLESTVQQNSPSKKCSKVDITDMLKTIKTGKSIIATRPYTDIVNFIRQQLTNLDKTMPSFNPRVLRDQFHKYSKMTLTPETTKEKQYWTALMNMYIFGEHRFNSGNLHMRYLRSYLNKNVDDLSITKRKSLFISYNYIFGYDIHPNINYPKLLKILIDTYDRNKNVSP